LRGLAGNSLKHSLIWGAGGIALAGIFFLMRSISPGFAYELSDLNKPIPLLVALMTAAGAVYLLVVWGTGSGRPGRGLLAWVLVLGLVLRVSMFASVPMLEDDHYRYLWDGGVLAKGFNPYRYSPADVLNDRDSQIPEALRELAGQAAPVAERINHPWLRTIYPPVTQAAFALAHIIRPWSMAAWRAVLLVADLVSLWLVFTILKRFDLSLRGLAVYWWNPLLVKEIYNSGHMDVLLMPFILGALLFSIQGRYVQASGALGLAVGVKFWPVILLPVVLRPVLGDPKRLPAPVLLFVGLSLIMFLPFVLTGLDAESGLTAFSRRWEMNDALFMVILWGVDAVVRGFSPGGLEAHTVTRVVVGLMVAGWTFWVIRKNARDPGETARRFLLVIAALFLMSPSQFPWYSLWMLPFLALRPRLSLLLLTALLPLYYGRSYFKARDMAHIHDYGIVWLEFLPVWGLLVWEHFRERKGVFTKGEERLHST
jgi:alpha-1,6-mannosyltransferase